MKSRPAVKPFDRFSGDLKFPAPGSGVARGFGRGYTITFLTFFCLFIGSFGNLYLSRNEPIRAVRAMAITVAIFGSTFLFGIGYHIAQEIPIPWTATMGSRVQQGEFDRRKSPVLFWLAVTPAVLFFAALIGGAIWLWLQAAKVAAAIGPLTN